MSDFVPVAGYRSTVTSIPGGIAVSIPSRRNYFVAAFLCVWLGGWYFGETSALHQLMSPSSRPGQDDSGFLMFWLCGWTLGGCFALVMALWNLAGRELVTVQSDAFAIRREAFGIGMGKRYELRSVKNLRVVETATGAFGSFGWGRRDPFGASSGPIAFDYGAKTIRFGAGVDSAEANHLLSRFVAAKPALSISKS